MLVHRGERLVAVGAQRIRRGVAARPGGRAGRRPLRRRERLEVLTRERVNVLCMSPTEYRAIAKRERLEPLPRSVTRARQASRSTRRWSGSGATR